MAPLQLESALFIDAVVSTMIMTSIGVALPPLDTGGGNRRDAQRTDADHVAKECRHGRLLLHLNAVGGLELQIFRIRMSRQCW